MPTWDVQHGDCRDVMRSLPPDSVDAIVSDPPYGLAFMGKEWDHGVPGVEFWTEALRVAKPGAHLLAFGGTRTFHRLAVAIEDAGWDIRDCVMWVYGSGFPKSHAIDKAIDKLDAKDAQMARRYRFTEWVRSTGVTAKAIDEATGTMMGSHYTTHPTQPAIMTREHLELCRPLLGEVPAWVEAECDLRSIESENFKRREVIGVQSVPVGHSFAGATYGGDSAMHDTLITAPATDAAKAWQGWGTALKPAWEPIIVARKPLIGTVAENVLTHGTGALNIDGCRVGTDVIIGRWPANVIHDGSEEVVGLFPQSKDGVAVHRNRPQEGSGYKASSYQIRLGPGADIGYGGSGSAARFFYTAKVSRNEREAGLGEIVNNHPTLKPIALMRYLCRLVTPPGGLVLDPFNGSGSTGCAAVLEGFRYLGCELDEHYVAISRARIAHWAGQHNAQQPEPDLFG
jgi:DNA modification methylase